MSRRAVKKMLRKGEEALAECRFAEAQLVYSEMLASFETEMPTLLDHAAAIYGLVRALHGANLDQEAVQLAESAVEMLSIHRQLEVAA